MDLRIHLRLRDQAAAVAEAAELNDPGSLRYGHFLTTEQFRATYAPTPEDVGAVRTWLQAQGLSYDYEAGNHLVLAVHGPVAQVEAAFQTRIARYGVRGETLRAPMTAPLVPAEVSTRVAAVLGFHDSFPTRPTLVRRGPGLPGGARSAGPANAAVEGPPGIWTAPPPGGYRVPPGCAPYWGAATYPDIAPFGTSTPTLAEPCGYTPPMLRKAYNLREHDGFDGSGVTVALVEAYQPQPTLLSDAQEYARRHDPAHPLGADQLQIVMAPGADPVAPPAESSIQGWYAEQALDVEAVHAMAPGATILVVFTKTTPFSNPAVEALNHIVDNNLATIVSNSYANPDFLPEDHAAWEAVATQANLKGIGLYFATGDYGDHVFRDVPAPSAAFPASLPQVTAVGGTSLGIDEKGRRLFEASWQESASTLHESSSGALLDGTWVPPFPGDFSGPIPVAGGGGTSRLYDQPSYQVGVVPDALARSGETLRRVVPDVSMLGCTDTGFLAGGTQTFPDGVYYDEHPVAGTSLSAPLLAGLVARAEQKRGSPIGFINPTLYKQRRKLVRDIVPQTVAPVLLPQFNNGVDAASGVSWYGIVLNSEIQTLHTTKGFDNTTGLGAPRVPQFIRRLGRK